MTKKELFDFIDSDLISINLYGNDGFDEQETKDGKEYLKHKINEYIDTVSMSKSILCECKTPNPSIINSNLCKEWIPAVKSDQVENLKS